MTEIDEKVHIGVRGKRFCDGKETEPKENVTDDMVGCVACMKKAVELMARPIYQWTYNKEDSSATGPDVPRGDAESPPPTPTSA